MESPTPSTLDGLTHLGLRAGVDMRPTLIRVLTDLYVQKLSHTSDEERHYTELALRLVDSVDIATRLAVADRLARHMAPPSRVVRRLAADLPSHPIAQLAKTMPKTPHAAAQPVNSAQPEHPATPALEQETHQADHDAGQCEPATASIAPAVAGELTELFFAADADERRLILLNLDIVVPTPPDYMPLLRDSMIAQRLEGAALAHNCEAFAQELARVLSISQAQARRIVGDELGEPIVVTAKALELPRDVVYRILLFANTTIGHSVERVHALAALYDEISPNTATHMVAIWQGLQRSERAVPRLQPLLWNDEARARARSATTAVRRAPTTQHPSERRSVS